MRRGFLLKAVNKEKGPDKRNDRALQPSKSKATHIGLQDSITKLQLPTSREDLPAEFRLPYGNLTDQEKALPEDYDKNNASLLSTQGTQFKTMPHIRDGDGSTEWVIRDKYAEGKVMNTPGYPACKPQPRPGLYEVRMTPDMGQGAFAKHNINRGELIFSERPLLIAPNWLQKVENERYTLDQNRQIMMFEQEEVLKVAVQRMNENDKALYTALYNSHTTDGSGPLLGIMRTNGFGASELSDDGGNNLLHYSAICNLGSRLNHSCMPNVIASFKISSFSYQFIAVRDIKAGEELYCAYTDLARTKAERRTDLAPYGFSCNCSACVNATPATDSLRKTFKGQVSRLHERRNQPELVDTVVSSAKLLETEMVAEGLDIMFEFFTLLCVIFVASDKLGRWADRAKYQQRVKEYCSIHIHDRPSLLQFLTL